MIRNRPRLARFIRQHWHTCGQIWSGNGKVWHLADRFSTVQHIVVTSIPGPISTEFGQSSDKFDLDSSNFWKSSKSGQMLTNFGCVWLNSATDVPISAKSGTISTRSGADPEWPRARSGSGDPLPIWRRSGAYQSGADSIRRRSGSIRGRSGATFARARPKNDQIRSGVSARGGSGVALGPRRGRLGARAVPGSLRRRRRGVVSGAASRPLRGRFSEGPIRALAARTVDRSATTLTQIPRAR